MTEHRALLWAISESPADDDPRLVYRDWLETPAGPTGARADGGMVGWSARRACFSP